MRLALILCIISLAVSTARAQYSVNWPKQPPTPMSTDVEAGNQTLKVYGVNDFLYKYDINVVEKGTPIQFKLVPSGAAGQCKNAPVLAYVTHVQKAYSAYEKLFPTTATPSVSLQTTQNQWGKTVQPFYSKLSSDLAAANLAINTLTGREQSYCQVARDSQKRLVDELKSADTKLNHSSHMLEVTFTAKRCKSEIITVIETYRGTPTGQSLTARLDVACDQFTVGAGVLLTEIQNRTYTSTALPGQVGQFLTVGGTSRFRPTLLVALMNFNLPLEPLGHKASTALGDLRLGISTGPVIQNSTSDVSTLGWFVGGTFSFLHRLYLSAGEHFGEFADFPPGFAPNQPIPPNFGTLTPVKRWTGRFAIGITIKGWDVSKMFKGGPEQAKTK